MKTSLISTAASSSSTSIKADPALRLKSVTVYFRGRKMVLMQRPQRRLSLLLCRMLRRSMLNLLGRLPAKLAAPVKKVLSAGALCAMALASVTTAHATATVDTLPVNTLPTNPAVVYGTAGVSTTGSQMNVDIGTNKAIINWGSFSIGSQAGVDFHFDNATSTSSVLNRVIGNDPSKIMGSLTSNGKVFLINSAGILVGKTAKIDVAGFVASTLNITNSDFLAGKMSFNDQHRHHRPAGDVVIEEDGSIKTKEGGSVYLIGANVENGGVITSPKGEVLLAAGHSVDLVDTGTPGVKINVKGDKGKVTNLGQIIAATGTIGFGAALINNSGVINASSVDKQGGRIFLRASKDLTTTETSSINADGTTGGNVVLYADNSANIDGDVSALGNVDGKGGAGGYVDTSGKLNLFVKYVPRISSGGEWYIDPYNVDILHDDQLVNNGVNQNNGAITATADSATIYDGTINSQLNNNVSVVISTGDSGIQNGDITVHSGVNIVRGGGIGADLTLTAANNININSGASISDTGTTGHMGLTLNAGGSITNDGVISLNGGDLNATAGTTIGGSGTIAMNGGNLNLHAVGNIALQTISGLGNLSFTSDMGTISQQSGTTLAGHSINATALKGIALNNTGNVLSNDGNGDGPQFIASNIDTGAGTSQGDISFRNDGTDTLLLGEMDNTHGNITITNTNAGLGSVPYSTGINAGGNVTLVANGEMLISNGNGISGQNVNLTTTVLGNVTLRSSINAVDTLKIDSAIGIDGDSSGITADTLDVTSHNGNIRTPGDGSSSNNHFNNLIASASSSTGGEANIDIGNTGNLTVKSVTALNGTVSISTKGKMTVDGSSTVTGKSVTLTATAGGGFGGQGGGESFVVVDPINADLILNGKLVATDPSGSVTLNSDGQILQGTATGSGIVAASLAANAVNGIYLNSTNNRVNSFSAMNGGYYGEGPSGAGNIELTNTTGNADVDFALTLGSIDNEVTANGTTDGNVKIVNTGSIHQDDSLNSDGYTNNSIYADGKVSLTANGALNNKGELVGGSIILGAIEASDLDVTANGSIMLSHANTVRLQVSGTMNAIANNGIDLAGGSNVAFRNQIANFSATNNVSGDIVLVNQNRNEGVDDNLLAITNFGTGDITVNNYGSLSTSGAITANNGTVALTVNGVSGLSGSMTIGGAISAQNIALQTVIDEFESVSTDIVLNAGLTAGNVNITSGEGIISQTAGGISAGVLSANAVGGITLNSSGNNVSAFSATNLGSGDATANGDIVFNNASTELLLNGNVTNQATGGNVSIANTGKITMVSNIAGGPPAITNGITTDNKVTLATTGSDGDVTLGKIVAHDLDVSSAQGKITSTTDHISLQIAGTMNATAKTGIFLAGNSNITFANHITNFGATNTGSNGDITLYNIGAGNKLLAITNNGGNVIVDNTGALEVVGAVRSVRGSVSLTAHSPLTVDASGSVIANSGIGLTAGDGTSGLDIVTVYGTLSNAIGAPQIAGNHVTMDGAVYGATPIYTSPNPVSFGPDYTYSPTPLIPPFTLPVDPSIAPPAPIVPPVVDQTVNSAANNPNSNIISSSGVVTTPNATNSSAQSTQQTTGGGDGEFGGSKDDSKDAKADKSGKPAPMCS